MHHVSALVLFGLCLLAPAALCRPTQRAADCEGLECWLTGLTINVPYSHKSTLFGVFNIVCDKVGIPLLASR
jgi:hypothetical protein